LIGEMTLGEAEDLLGAWDEEPPAFLSLARIEAMLAALLGVKRKAPPASPTDQVRGLKAHGAGLQVLDFLKARLGTGGDVHAGLGGAAILDFAALKAGTHGLHSSLPRRRPGVHQRSQPTGEKSGR
jgi:hypothetical protein